MKRWDSLLVPDVVANSLLFRRFAFATAYLAFGVSAALVIVALFFKELSLRPLVAANWLLMMFVYLAWSRIPPDRSDKDLKLRKLAGWIVLTFMICGMVAISQRPGL